MQEHEAHGAAETEDEGLSFDEDAPRPLSFRFVPWLFRFDHGPPEATGLAIDIYARGAVLMSSLFLGPALLELAANAAKENDGRVYHMKPSSLLSNIAIASGLLATVTLPLFGAIVDKTPYRKNVGVISALGLAVIKGTETIVSAETFIFVALLQILSAAVYYIHTCATYAYTCELSRSHVDQTKYNSYYFVVLYTSTLIFMGEVLVLASVFDTNDVGTARISQVITCATSLICFGVAWRYFFRERPALSSVPVGTTLLTCGFQQIFSSVRRIRRELPALKFLMLSVTFSESATGALITIASTYMKIFLGMDATEIGVVFLVVLIMGGPGSKFGEILGLAYNPVTSAKLCVICFIATTAVATVVLTGPQDKQFVVIFGGLWGLELGWLHPMHSTIFITIIPSGQESELMGIYLFCGQVLSWLPPLLFTGLNEWGVEMSIGLASLNLFFAAGLYFLFRMGSYDNAIEMVRPQGESVTSPVSEIELDSPLPQIT